MSCPCLDCDPIDGIPVRCEYVEPPTQWELYSCALSDPSPRAWFDRANDDFNIYTFLRRRYASGNDRLQAIAERASPFLSAVERRAS